MFSVPRAGQAGASGAPQAGWVHGTKWELLEEASTAMAMDQGPPDTPLPYPQAAQLPTENALLPAKPLPPGSERKAAQTPEPAESPSNTVGAV